MANYALGAVWNSQIGNLTTVGSAGMNTAGMNSESYYGTLDQGGNVYEWTEALGRDNINPSERGTVGGSFDTPQDALQSRRDGAPPSFEAPELGFRVASPFLMPPVPSVSTWGLAIMLILIIAVGTIVFHRKPHGTTAH